MSEADSVEEVTKRVSEDEEDNVSEQEEVVKKGKKKFRIKKRSPRTEAETTSTPTSTVKRKPKIVVVNVSNKKVTSNDNLGDTPLRSTGTWKINNKQIFLIYNAIIDREEIKTLIAATKMYEELYVSNKEGKTYVYIKFVAGLYSNRRELFDIKVTNNNEDGVSEEIITPEIRLITRNKVNETRVKSYFTDEDNMKITTSAKTPVFTPFFEDSSWVDGILSAKSAVDAIKKYAKCPNDVPGIIALYNIKPAQEEHKIDIIYTWKGEMWRKLCMRDWDYNRPTWLIGPTGFEGKTLFINTFRSNYEVHVINSIIGLLTFISLGVSSYDYIFVDLPYSNQNHKAWKKIECLSCGNESIIKYKDTYFSISGVKFVFLTRWEPYFTEEKLDSDIHYRKCFSPEAEGDIVKNPWLVGKIYDSINEKTHLPDKVLSWE